MIDIYGIAAEDMLMVETDMNNNLVTGGSVYLVAMEEETYVLFIDGRSREKFHQMDVGPGVCATLSQNDPEPLWRWPPPRNHRDCRIG